MKSSGGREWRWLAFFIAMAVAHTWPLAGGLASLSRHDSADAQLNEWILAWVAHALAVDPRHLFDANIFFPERHTLAFSEHLLTESLVAAPLIWLGAPTLVAHNVTLIAGFALTGWTMAMVVTRWTNDRWAGVTAGCLLAFNAHSLTRLAHVQAAHVEFLPLALASLDLVLVNARVRSALALAVWTALQSLCSGYLLVMTGLSLALASLARGRELLGHRGWRVLALLGLAAALTLSLLAPTLWPYRAVRREQGLVRSIDEVVLYSATPRSYLSTAGRLHQALWGERFFSADSLFPGVAGAGLMLVALVSGIAWRESRARMLLAMGIAGVVLSFGPQLSIYRWLYAGVPLLQGIRGAARFGELWLFAVAGLAGFGVARLRQSLVMRSNAMAVALGVAAVAAVTVEAWRAPIHWTPASTVSPVYDALAREPGAVVVEMPFPGVDRTGANAPFVLASTRHFRPLLNGYSGFVPASYAEHAARLAHFPDEESRRFLHTAGVTHVVVHESADVDLARRAQQTPWLAPRVHAPGITLYAIAR
jgi:hypothetical protein